MKFTAKDPAEIINLTFDFGALSGTVSNPVMGIVVESGNIDNTPSAMLSGSAQISGAVVTQKIIGGQAGTTYKLRCQIDTPTGARYVLTGSLPVATA
jgi:hypothetical protein